MKREIFNLSWAALLNAFPNSDRVTDETQKLYFEMLGDIPDDIWQEGVKQCLRTLTFFPTIHDIGVACFGARKEEWVDKCDPLRERQNYREKVPAISWQENMARILERRGLIAPERIAIESPKRDDQKREEGTRLRKALDEIRKLRAANKELLNDRWNLMKRVEELKAQLTAAAQPKMSIEERRAKLKEQAKILGVH